MTVFLATLRRAAMHRRGAVKRKELVMAAWLVEDVMLAVMLAGLAQALMAIQVGARAVLVVGNEAMGLRLEAPAA